MISRASSRVAPSWRHAPGAVVVRALSMDNKGGGGAKPNMALIKELREASGAPVVDCKNALAVRQEMYPLSMTNVHLRTKLQQLQDDCCSCRCGFKTC